MSSLRYGMSALLRSRFLSASRLNLYICSLARSAVLCACGTQRVVHPTSARGVIATMSTLSFLNSLRYFRAQLCRAKTIYSDILRNSMCTIKKFSPYFNHGSVSLFMGSLITLNVSSVTKDLCTSISVGSALG